MFDILDIVQLGSWEFVLKNWPRSISLKYESVWWLYDWYFADIEEFDLIKAKKFYRI